MEWSTLVEELLQKSLKLGEDMEIFKTSAEENSRKASYRLDQKLEASSKELKQLQEESDSLFARSIGVSEEVQAVKNSQKTHFNQVDEEIAHKSTVIEQMAYSLTRLRDILSIKNDPERQFFTPPVTFTLENFHERKNTNDCWFSPHFYSHKYGYKMQLKVLPNGAGEGAGTHISLFVILVPGEFDELLTWPFCGIITVHLINQRRNGLNVAHSVSYTSIDNLGFREKPLLDVDIGDRLGDGALKFIAHAELGEGAGLLARKEYLKNNCLSFRVWSITVFTQHH